MADEVPGKNRTSAPPGSALANSYKQLQEYLIHKPTSLLSEETPSKTTWSLAGKEILGSDGVFFTSDIFARNLDKQLEIKKSDLTIYWTDQSGVLQDRPFSSVGLKSYIGYRGTTKEGQTQYDAAVKEFDQKIRGAEAVIAAFYATDRLIVHSFDVNTGNFTVAATTNASGSIVDPEIKFNLRSDRATPQLASVDVAANKAASVTTRTIGQFGKNATQGDVRARDDFFNNITVKLFTDLNPIFAKFNSSASRGIAGSSKFNVDNTTPTLSNPNVTLYEYTGDAVTIETSTTDYCDAFFNLIDNVNFSLAVPFVRINIIDRLSKSKGKSPRLSLVSFLRPTGDKDIDDSIFAGARPVLKDVADNVSKKVLSGKYVGNDVFQSPATLLPDPTELITNPRRLDPSVPLMTLQSLNISIESQGAAMLSRKRGEMSIIIHDRSRLKDVSSLLSLGDFSTLYFDIEWGYIHPHGNNLAFDNPIGQYLNSMRLREVYAPNTYSLTMGENGAVTVSINMLAGGYLDGTNTPVSTGDYVARSLATRMMTTYINNVNLQATIQDQVSPPDVRPITEILVSKDTEGKFVNRSFIELLIKRPDREEVIMDEEKKFIEELKTALEVSDSAQALKTTDLIADLEKSLKDSNVKGFGEDVFRKISAKYTGTTPNSYASVGNILTQCVGIPLAMSGLYSEVQIHVFRFNGDAGTMSNLPITQACVPIENFIGKSDEPGSLYNADSVTTALSRLGSLLSNPDALTYGLATLPSKDEKGTPAKKDAAPPPSAGAPAGSAAASATAAGAKSPDGKTPAFTTPNFKYDFRTVLAKVFNADDTKPIDAVPDPELPILQVIIYDDNRLINASDLVKAYKYLSSKRKDNITGGSSSKSDNNLSLDDAKTLSKIAYPNITYGAVNSVIKSVAVSTNSRSAIGTYATIQAGKEMLNDQLKSVTTTEIRQMQLIPGNVTLTIFGLPIIERGQSIYLDLGTGTTLDQLYKVTAVRHNLSSDFTTDLTLQFVGQGTLVNLENVIDNYLKDQEKLDVKKTPTTPPEQPTSAPTKASDDPRQARREYAAAISEL